MFSTSSSLNLIELALLFVSASMLFRITSIYNGNTAFHRFNYLFIGTSAVYACFAIFVESPLLLNITMYLWGAALVGLLLSSLYKQPRVKRIKRLIKIRPPKKPRVTTKRVVAKKKVAKKTSKKSAKKTVKKVTKKTSAKTTTKKVAGKTTKKSPAKKKVVSKKSVKKASKKSVSKAKKSSSKKSTKRYVAKRTMKKVSTKKSSGKNSTKKTSRR